MGWTSCRKLHDVLANVRTVLAVEVVCAAQGLDFRADTGAPSPAVAAVHARLRSEVASMVVDRTVHDQIAAAERLMPDLVAAAESAAGPLR
jgi:histidine ammonia-lyase